MLTDHIKPINHLVFPPGDEKQWQTQKWGFRTGLIRCPLLHYRLQLALIIVAFPVCDVPKTLRSLDDFNEKHLGQSNTNRKDGESSGVGLDGVVLCGCVALCYICHFKCHHFFKIEYLFLKSVFVGLTHSAQTG